MLIVHLFVSCAWVCVAFSLPPGVGGWLRLLLVALPGLFGLPFNSLFPPVQETNRFMEVGWLKK